MTNKETQAQPVNPDPFAAFEGVDTIALYVTDRHALKPAHARDPFSFVGTEHGLDPVPFNEYGDFWKFLTRNTTDNPDILRYRQQALSELISLRGSGELEHRFGEALLFARNHQYLQELIPVHVPYQNEPEWRKRIDVYLGELGEAGDDPLNPDQGVNSSVLGILTNLEADYGRSVAASEGFIEEATPPFLKAVVGKNLEAMRGAANIDGRQYVDIERGRRAQSDSNVAESLQETLSVAQCLGYVAELSRGVDELEWKPVAIGNTDSLHDAWNLQYDSSRQVPNDHFVRPTMFVTGSNMSGKSIYTQAGFLSTVAAQAFGFAPVESGSLSPKGSLMLLEKPDSNPLSGLSSFGAEAIWWGETIERIESLVKAGKVPGLWSDEPFSSTDPEEQKVLIEALTHYFRRIGATVVMATHADLSGLPEDYHDKFFHLATHTGEDGLPVFDYTLAPGHAESDALNVAKQLGLPDSILSRAMHIFESGFQEALYVPEREFPIVDFPETDITDLIETADLGLGIFLNSGPLGLPSDDPDDSLYLRRRPYDGGVVWLQRPIDETVSGALGFEKRGVVLTPSTDSEITTMSPFIYGNMFERLVTEGATSSPAELKLRQELFESLVNGGEDIDNIIKDGLRLLDTIYALSGDYKGGEGLSGHRSHKPMEDIGGALIGVGYELINSDIQDFRYRNVTYEEVRRAQVERIEATLSLLESMSGCDAFEISPKIVAGVAALRALANTYREFILTAPDELYGLDIAIPQEARDHMAEFMEDGEDFYSYKWSGNYCDSETWRKLEKIEAARMNNLILGGLELILDKVLDDLPGVPVSGLDFPDYEALSERVRSVIQPMHKRLYETRCWTTLNLVSFLGSDEDVPGNISLAIDRLNTPYASQLSKYLRQLTSEYFDGNTSGSTYLNWLKAQSKTGNIKNRPTAQATELFSRSYSLNTSPPKTVYHEVERIIGLFELAKWMQKTKLQPVTFSSSGVTEASDIRIPTRWHDEQVPNDALYADKTRADILTGPNMSGKTSLLKSHFWLHTLAQTTGFAAVSEATVPIYDKIIYLDRIPAEVEKGLSSFGTEINNWRKAFEHLENSGPSLVLLDEPFSSTAESYQRALIEACLHELIAQGHTVLMSTHNHRFVNEFEASSNGNGSVEFHRLSTGTDSAGEIVFEYKRTEGVGPSFALEVVRKLSSPALRAVIDDFVGRSA